jgi:hypothetical protein
VIPNFKSSDIREQRTLGKGIFVGLLREILTKDRASNAICGDIDAIKYASGTDCKGIAV